MRERVRERESLACFGPALQRPACRKSFRCSKRQLFAARKDDFSPPKKTFFRCTRDGHGIRPRSFACIGAHQKEPFRVYWSPRIGAILRRLEPVKRSLFACIGARRPPPYVRALGERETEKECERETERERETETERERQRQRDRALARARGRGRGRQGTGDRIMVK